MLTFASSERTVLLPYVHILDPGAANACARADHRGQPYLDSDMTSRFWDFGGDTVVRADKYEEEDALVESTKTYGTTDTFDLRAISPRELGGYFPRYR